MIIVLLAGLVFGMGLIFYGQYILSENLKYLVDIKFRQALSRYAQNRYMGVLSGGVFMVVTQSAVATNLILLGMIRASLIKLSQSLPVIIGFNICSSLILILLLLINIKSFILIMIGVTGLMYTLLQQSKLKHISGCLLGIGLLFLGIFGLKDALAPFVGTDTYLLVSNWVGDGYLLMLVIGIFVSCIVQSSFTSIVLLIPFAHIGIVGLGESIMYVYGANLGTALLNLVFARNMNGSIKQLSVYFSIYNILGGLIFIPLFYVEYLFHVPLVQSLVSSATDDMNMRIAYVFFTFNLIPGLLLLHVNKPITNLLNKYWPESDEERLSKPKFIHKDALKESSSALTLIQLEQQRLIEIFCHEIDALRSSERHNLNDLEDSFRNLFMCVHNAIHNLTQKRELSSDELNRLNLLMAVNHQIESTQNLLSLILNQLKTLERSPHGKHFYQSCIEGIDTVILLLNDLASEFGEEDYLFFTTITSEEGNGIKAVRQNYVNQTEMPFSTEQKLEMLAITNYSESLMRLLNQLGVGLNKLNELNHR